MRATTGLLFLCLTGTACVPSAPHPAMRATAEETALVVLKERGAELLRDLEAPDEPVIGVLVFSGNTLRDADLIHLKALPRLQKLDLTDSQITDAGLEHLKDLPQLREVYLGGSRVSDAGIAALETALPEVQIWR